MFGIKGSLCSFGQDIQTKNCYIYNVNEVMLQILIKTQEYLFFRTEQTSSPQKKIKCPEHCVKGQGPPHTKQNTLK